MKKRIIVNYLSLVICVIFIVSFYMRNISELTMPAILLDEIGYWAPAAHWNGWDWSGVMSSFSGYYSFGYSMVLFILMQLFHDAAVLHQSAIVVNIFMIIITYFCMNNIVKKFFPHIGDITRNIGCAIPLFYPSIQYHTQVAWSETYLFMLFVLSAVLAIKIFESGKCIYYALFALVLIDMYVAHQRSVGIVLVGVILILAQIALDRKIRRSEIIFFSILFAGLLIGILIKQDLYNAVYTDSSLNESAASVSEQVSGNDYSGQIVKLKYILTIEGFKNLMISMGGKIYYFLIASLFFGGEGLWYLAKRTFSLLKHKEDRNTGMLVLPYILVSYIATVCIAAIFMVYPGRLDTVAYGRYTDWVGILIITFGIFSSMSLGKKTAIIHTFVMAVFVLVFTVVFQNYINYYNVSGFFASCSQIMTYFKELDSSQIILIMSVTMVLLSFIVRIILFVKLDVVKITCMAIIMLRIWTVLCEPAIDELIRIQWKERVCPITEYIYEYQDADIYYLYNETTNRSSNFYTGSIQYILQGRKVNCVTELPESCDADDIVIIGADQDILENYEVEVETDYYKLIIRSE